MISELKKYLKHSYARIVIKNKLPFFRNSNTERVGNITFTYPYRPYFYGLYYEIFVEQNYHLDGIENCQVILDAGANIGISAGYFSQVFPQAKIECFEPNPEAIEYLKKNIENNKLNAVIHPYALAAEENEMIFYVDNEVKGSSNAGTNNLMQAKNRSTREIRVQAKKLSSFINSQVDILKLDIEGAEMDVLRDLIASKKINMIRNMFIEFHYDPKNLPQSLAEFLSLLEQSNFFYYISKRQTINRPEKLLHSYIIFAFSSK